MELRKIQKTGGGTYLVFLPKDWAEKKGLDKGSLVEISERVNGRLTIDPQYNLEKVPQVATIKPTSYLNREIIGMYLLGNDIIRVEAKERISLNEFMITVLTSLTLACQGLLKSRLSHFQL